MKIDKCTVSDLKGHKCKETVQKQKYNDRVMLSRVLVISAPLYGTLVNSILSRHLEVECQRCHLLFMSSWELQQLQVSEPRVLP